VSARGRTIARWAVALAIVAVLVTLTDLGAIGARLAAADLPLAIPAIAGLVAVHLVGALSWRRLTAVLAGTTLDWPTTIHLYYAAQAIGTVTPGNLGADVHRVTALGEGIGRGRLARAVIIQRLTSIGGLVYLGLIGALSLPIAGLGPFVLLLGGLGAVAALAVVLLSASPSRRSGIVGEILERLGLDDEGATLRGRLRSAFIDGFGIGLVFHVASLVLGLVLVAAVDPLAAGQPIVVLGALAVARLSLAVPIAPHGIGVQEGALAVLFIQLGLPAETALAAALLNRLAMLLTAALGSVGLFAGGRARPALVARS
jgi:uncharacterized membrane protein YbhN (UPF0104 family)